MKEKIIFKKKYKGVLITKKQWEEEWETIDISPNGEVLKETYNLVRTKWFLKYKNYCCVEFLDEQVDNNIIKEMIDFYFELLDKFRELNVKAISFQQIEEELFYKLYNYIFYGRDWVFGVQIDEYCSLDMNLQTGRIELYFFDNPFTLTEEDLKYYLGIIQKAKKLFLGGKNGD